MSILVYKYILHIIIILHTACFIVYSSSLDNGKELRNGRYMYQCIEI